MNKTSPTIAVTDVPIARPATVPDSISIGVCDHIFFNFSIAINTYFQKVAEPEDISPSMAVSFTINHIAAVIIPAIGGLLWMHDYRIPFYAGAAMSLVSLIFVQFIRTHHHEESELEAS